MTGVESVRNEISEDLPDIAFVGEYGLTRTVLLMDGDSCVGGPTLKQRDDGLHDVRQRCFARLRGLTMKAKSLRRDRGNARHLLLSEIDVLLRVGRERLVGG